MKPHYLKITHIDIHLLIDILDELEKTPEECELQAKLEEIYRRMRDARDRKRLSTFQQEGVVAQGTISLAV